MAMNIVLSCFYIPMPAGHLYLNDVVICLGSILLDPFEAFMVGGVGSFLGDLFVYPDAMFVSLVTHGLQAVVISLFSHKILKDKPRLSSGIGVSIGVIIMVTGYTLGSAFVYGSPATALAKMPHQIVQAVIGAVIGMFICWKCGIHKLFNKIIKQ